MGKKLLSEVEHLTYSPISPIPYPLSDSLSNTSHKEADILLSCPPRITFSCQSLQLPSNSVLRKGSMVALHNSVLWFYFIITARHRVVSKSWPVVYASLSLFPESLRYYLLPTSWQSTSFYFLSLGHRRPSSKDILKNLAPRTHSSLMQ